MGRRLSQEIEVSENVLTDFRGGTDLLDAKDILSMFAAIELIQVFQIFCNSQG
jgi:hypothetical protein